MVGCDALGRDKPLPCRQPAALSPASHLHTAPSSPHTCHLLHSRHQAAHLPSSHSLHHANLFSENFQELANSFRPSSPPNLPSRPKPPPCPEPPAPAPRPAHPPAARQAALPSLNAGSGRRLTPQHAFHLLSEVVPGIFSEAGPALGAGSGETGRDTVWEKPWQRLEVPRGHAGREAGTIKWGSAGRRRRDRHRRRRKQRRRLRTTCRVPSAPLQDCLPFSPRIEHRLVGGTRLPAELTVV